MAELTESHLLVPRLFRIIELYRINLYLGVRFFAILIYVKR